MTMLDMLAWAIFAAAAIPALVLAAELTAAQFPAARLPDAGSIPSLAVIIPAHDESAGISATVDSVRKALPPGARLVVVADNCRDDTAARATAAGAELIEREDAARHGKSHALAFARDHLAQCPPDVVVVIDADCTVGGDGIARLAGAAQATGRPVQSAYLLRPRPDLGIIVALSGFAFLVRNLVRQRALAWLGAPALLTGSGMAFPWSSFAAAPLGTDDLAEDLAIAIALARRGIPPAFLGEVTTWSDPASRAAAKGQRRRWEQGFLRVAAREIPALLGSGEAPLIRLGLHLTVPPLVLLMIAEALTLALLAGLAARGAAASPFAMLAALLTWLVAMLLIAWARFGRAQVRGWQLLAIPIYMLWKLPLYIAALLRPERRWQRTDRD